VNRFSGIPATAALDARNREVYRYDEAGMDPH
jgi:hypothetical protein